MRLVLDTNAALSGLLWSGPPARLIIAAQAGAIELVSSVPLLNELRDVLGRAKFARQLAMRGVDESRVFADYVALVSIVAPAVIPPAVIDDPADDAVLATAVAAQADLIVSGDSHLLRLRAYQTIAIVNATVACIRANVTR